MSKWLGRLFLLGHKGPSARKHEHEPTLGHASYGRNYGSDYADYADFHEVHQATGGDSRNVGKADGLF
jgi:hypothetical protein